MIVTLGVCIALMSIAILERWRLVNRYKDLLSSKDSEIKNLRTNHAQLTASMDLIESKSKEIIEQQQTEIEELRNNNESLKVQLSTFESQTKRIKQLLKDNNPNTECIEESILSLKTKLQYYQTFASSLPSREPKSPKKTFFSDL